ncbi:DUF3800 domain-containing protein [Mucilaginibacter sp. R-33]|uniref:DUF3800 domain-containing protein n=1 Tax=Mucilaginibacter sp. R-33 TaxID=3416711 RepID=UPI003CE97DA6
MMKHVFVIDDTGSPGNKSESLMLRSDRVTYVAVFIAADIREELALAVQNLLSKHNLQEFHFTDLINRRKEYAGLSTDSVINLFKDFTGILNRYRLPYFVQTITPRTLAENGLSNNLNKTLDEIALDFLFARIVHFVKVKRIHNQFEVWIDSGKKKHGHSAEVPNLRRVTKDNIMLYQSSDKNVLIQVADFFAFAMNRNQLIAIKPSRTAFDIVLITLLNSVFFCNESSGSASVLYDEKIFTKEDYDTYQIEKFKELGVFEYWKKVMRD